MKTIKIKDYSQIPNDFTGIAEYPDGYKVWCLNGLRHRENDLPAVEYPNGTKEWWINGLLHRDNDLPAVEYADGSKVWFLNGKEYSEEEWKNLKMDETIKVKDYSEIPKGFMGIIEFSNGSKEWYANGNKYWFLNGKEYSEEEWKNLKMDEIIKIKDYSEIPKGFTGIVEFSNGTKSWYKNGKLHRENDLPAVECSEGNKFWYLNDRLHRENGPAVEYSDGTKHWFLNGKNYSEEDWKKEEVGKMKATKTTKEIERKFLCNNRVLNEILGNSNIAKADNIVQGYLSADPTVRVRIVETADKTTAFLTIKGKGLITRDEFEYNIPAEDAKEMLEKLSDRQLKKTRYYIDFKNHSWSVDVFPNGLILAEIELSDENEKFEVPPWVIMEVSLIKEFSNVALAQKTTK